MVLCLYDRYAYNYNANKPINQHSYGQMKRNTHTTKALLFLYGLLPQCVCGAIYRGLYSLTD